MKKTKILCIIAAAITVLGLLTAFASLLLVDFDFNRFSGSSTQTNIHEFTETIENISIDTTTADIRFEKSEDHVCRVVCKETENFYHTTSLENGTLTLKLTKTKKWYQKIGIFSGVNNSITVYLPENHYQTLTVQASTGDVTIPKEFSFASIRVHVSTGDITCSASATDSIDLKVSTGDITASNLSANQFKGDASSGDITLRNIKIGKDVTLETNTGTIIVTDLQAVSLSAKSTTGSQTYTNLLLSASLTATASTGDIIFDRSDAVALTIETSTGDVMGTLLSSKIFYANTSTGDVKLPHSTSGGLCEITTNTGDIKLSIAK